MALTTAGFVCAAPPVGAFAKETRMTNVETAKAFIRAIESGETESLTQYLTADFVQHELPNLMTPKGQSRGVAGIVEGAKKGQEILEWQRYDITNVVAEGDWVVLETHWVGKLSVALGKLPVGYEMKADIAILLQFRDGKIALQRNYDSYHPL